MELHHCDHALIWMYRETNRHVELGAHWNSNSCVFHGRLTKTRSWWYWVIYEESGTFSIQECEKIYRVSA